MTRTAFAVFAWIFILLAVLGFLMNDFKFLVLCGMIAVTLSGFSRKE